MPHYSAENPDCAPSAFLASTWRYDELAGYGSYCNMQVGIDGADTHIRSLQDGMPSRGIWFAGEHAAPIEERGTVGGAWLSAEIAAEKIIAKHRQSSLQASVP
jgi:monoamine oxidase